MKKYIPYFTVFFVILLIVITIEENKDRPPKTGAGTIIAAVVGGVVGGVLGNGSEPIRRKIDCQRSKDGHCGGTFQRNHYQ